MPDLANPHDRFFKFLLSRQETARDFLRTHLPAEITGALDLSAIELVKDTFIDAALQEHASDLLYKVRLPDGKPAYVYLLLEHKSYPDPLVAFQLLRYIVRIWEYNQRQNEPYAPIIPLVVYHGRAEWQVGLRLRDLVTVPQVLAGEHVDFGYHLADLSRFPEEEIALEVGHRIALLAAHAVAEGNWHERLPQILTLCRDLLAAGSVLEMVAVLLRYVAATGHQVQRHDVEEIVTRVFGEGGSTLMTTMAEAWIEEGRAEGRAEGLQQGLQLGLQQGQREELLAGIRVALDVKFGDDGLRLLPELRAINDLELLRSVRDAIKPVASVQELRRIYQPPRE